MADLKRRVFEAERQLQDLGRQHASLLRRYENVQKEFDAILQLLIALARQAQDRTLGPKNLRVQSKYVERQDPAWAIATDTPKGKDYVEIRAIHQVVQSSSLDKPLDGPIH